MGHISNIVDVDGEAGVALPDQLLQRWGLKLGDELTVMEDAGRLLLQPLVRPPSEDSC